MIRMEVPARMHCDEPGCTMSSPVALLLTGAGGFVFKPKGNDWQVILPQSNVTAPFLTRCPEHKQTIQKPGIIPGRLAT